MTRRPRPCRDPQKFRDQTARRVAQIAKALELIEASARSQGADEALVRDCLGALKDTASAELLRRALGSPSEETPAPAPQARPPENPAPLATVGNPVGINFRARCKIQMNVYAIPQDLLGLYAGEIGIRLADIAAAQAMLLTKKSA